MSKNQISIHLNNDTKNYIIEKGFNEEFGVRYLARTIDKEILSPISRIILEKKIKNAIINVGCNNNVLLFDTVPSSN